MYVEMLGDVGLDVMQERRKFLMPVSGFAWLVVDDYSNSIYAYCRNGRPGTATEVAICKFTPMPRLHYRSGVPHGGPWREILNPEAEIYGGSNLGNGGWIQAKRAALARPVLLGGHGVAAASHSIAAP